MRNDVLQLVLAFLVLTLGAGCEVLSPKVMGVGCPVLLACVVFLARRFELAPAVLLAVAAGATEDALSALTPMTSVSYFLIVTALVRRIQSPIPAAIGVFPCYQLWLAVWMGGFNVFARILMAFPAGLLTAFVVQRAVSEIYERAAIDGRG